MAFRFGEILLATLAFSDASGAKIRPVLVLQDTGDADLLIVPVTSHPPRSPEDVALASWGEAGLRLPSTARTAKLATLAKSAVVRPMGRVSAEDARKLREGLRRFLAGLLA